MSEEKKIPFVLVVDDDRDIAAYYRHVMDLAGYRTEVATNGKVAVEFLFKNPPDIILLDLSLPGLPGVDILQILRSDDRLKKIHVVVITGYSQIAAELSVEPDLVLLKPVSPGQLTDLVGRLSQDDSIVEKHPFGKNPWDKTTGLYTRSFFVTRLGSALRNAKENRQNLFAVLLVSPLHQKGIQASLDKKHKTLSLQATAKHLKAHVRPTDTIARFDHEHFYILVENLHSGDILSMIAERIQPSLGEHPAGERLFSIGALLCDDGYDNIDEILTNVKTAHFLMQTHPQQPCRIFTRETIKEINEEAVKLSRALPA